MGKSLPRAECAACLRIASGYAWLMFLRHNWLVFCVMPGLTGHLDPRSESGMTMEFGDGSPIGVGDD